MANIENLFRELCEEISELNRRYLDNYFPAQPEHTPDIFEYDVKSFCVLAHACFEEFIEQVSESILNEIPNDFLLQKISLSTATLLLNYSARPTMEIDEDSNLDSCFEMVRNALDDCKKKHAASIKDNHGFSLKYLRRMLVPVGLNARFGPTETTAIKKLADARGSFAHARSKSAVYGEHKRASTPLPPDEAKDIVQDCLRACEAIKESASRRW